MSTMLAPLLALLLSIQPATQPAASADDWKEKVMETAGADVWPSVTRLQFTFHVDRPSGESVSRTHDWNLVDGTATITTPDGTETTIRPWAFDADRATEAEKQAFQQWTNDGYWLLMPLKLGDGGVKFSPVMTTRDMPASRANTTMSFEEVGLTPRNEYDLSIDLRRGVVDQWTFRPTPEADGTTWTWEGYEDFNGLMLSTMHTPQNGGPTIRFTEIEVTR